MRHKPIYLWKKLSVMILQFKTPASLRTSFVNCQLAGCFCRESLLISSAICCGSRGVAHLNNVDVRLVSFQPSGVRNNLLSNRVPPHNVTSRARRFFPSALVDGPALATPVVAMFSPVRSTRQFPLPYAATTASLQRRA